jgi:molybdate transport system substrate-binding protein
VLSNALVIVVPAGSRLVIARPEDLARPEVRRIALGDPLGVPAGVYAREWLTALGVYGAIASRVVPLPSSPAAVAAVAEGRAQAGVVYATDVRNDRVRVASVAHGRHVPAITYPAAAVAGGDAGAAQAFLAFLRSEVARAIFERTGFRTPPAR